MQQLSLKEPFFAWLQKLYQQLQQAPLLSRMPLLIERERVGSVELPIAESLVAMGLLNLDPLGLTLSKEGAEQELEKIADWLHERQLSDRWTGEKLPVHDLEGQTLAGIERAVVRTLGITTHAVYLIGRHEDGRLWLQKRSMSKSTGPGKLDILVGGLVSMQETCEQALKREAWEEAGIDLKGETAMPSGVTYICQPVDSTRGGYMVEIGHWYEKILPPDFEPVNQDGEVQEFMLCTPEEIKKIMLTGELTDEAAWVLVRYLGLC